MEKNKNEDEEENNSINDDSDNEKMDSKKLIIKLFDEQVQQNKENFLNLSKILERKEKIFRMSQNLKLDIKNLEQVVSDILDKQKDDYLSAFSQFMDSIKSNLTMQLEEMEKAFEEKRKTNDIRIIRCERDFFKSEAFRLNRLTIKLKEELEEINLKYKIIKVELTNMQTKYKETENINKQLLSDIENKIIEKNKSKSLKDKKINLKENQIHLSTICNGSNNNSKICKSKNISNIHVDTSTHERISNSQNASFNPDVNCLTNLYKKTKYQLKREKDKANKAIAELSKIYLEKNILEHIFQNCVEETKKLIFNRKIMENKFYKIKNPTGLFKYELGNRTNFSIKFEEFLPSDKQKTLEKFIFDDEVYNIVKDIIFKRQKNKQMKDYISTPNIYTNTLHFSGTESKTKTLIDIPKIKFAKKKIEIFPIMKNKKLSFINSNIEKNDEIHKNRVLTINSNS